MQKIYILAAFTVLLVIGALVAGFGLSTGWAVKALQDEALARLGRTLEVKDGASLEFSPRLALRFDGVALANPEGFEGNFITAPSLRVPVSFGDIFNRRIAGRFELAAPEISFEVSLKGDVSWAGPGKGPALPQSENILIEDGTIRYYDQRNQQSMVLSKASMAAELSPAGELTASGNAVIGERLSTITAYVKELGRVSSTGSPLDLSIDSPYLKLAFNGRLSTSGALNLAGPLTLEGPSLRDAAKWVNMAIPGDRGLAAFSISGTLDSSGIDFTLRNSAISLEGLSASGDIGVTANRLAPLVFAKLALPALRLEQFIDGPDFAATQWSEAPITYEGLRGLSARVTLVADQLSFGEIKASGAAVEASLAEGRLSAVMSSDDLAGGRGRVDLELDGSSEAPLFSARLVSQGGSAAALLKQFTGQGWIAAALDADVAISGYGGSLAAIVSTLKGTATFKANDGALAGVDGGALMAKATQQIAEGWGAADASTTFESLTASFTIADGIATTNDLKLDGPAFTADATGQVDLLRRAIDLSVLPSLTGADGKTVQLPVPVVVKGPWASPRIYPDVADILLNPEGGFARLKELGLPAQPPSGN
jgi:AsmA protein